MRPTRCTAPDPSRTYMPFACSPVTVPSCSIGIAR
jgi:hypothetical protein